MVRWRFLIGFLDFPILSDFFMTKCFRFTTSLRKQFLIFSIQARFARNSCKMRHIWDIFKHWYFCFFFQIRTVFQEDNKRCSFCSFRSSSEAKKRTQKTTFRQYMEFGTNISPLAKQFQQSVRQRVIIG